MNKFLLLFLCFITISVLNYGQNIEAYRIFDAKAKPVSTKKMLKELAEADIILFGEFHNNPISHWLEYEVSYYLSQNNKITFGAEMFESDNQNDLNNYLKDEIDKATFDSLVRLWPNYETDYSQLVLLAKKTKSDFIATNVPRKYAKLVNQNGFESLDSLPDEEKQWIAPMPVDFDPELNCYKKMMGMMMGQSSPNLPKAQAIKDATMAYFILKYYKDGYIFIHFNGAYHSDNYEGILWYLKKLNPDLRYVTISTVSQNYVNKLYNDNKGIADYIICVDNNMTTSY
ncbi:MAG TPA: ChaN family lipoprotein [Bacteroidales bacterium]|nr:ChaN family lipoprotein [Bacteroidales bacterium]